MSVVSGPAEQNEDPLFNAVWPLAYFVVARPDWQDVALDTAFGKADTFGAASLACWTLTWRSKWAG